MNDFDKVPLYINSVAEYIKNSFYSIKNLAILLTTVFIALSGTQQALLGLCFVLIVDLITGTIAAYIEDKREGKAHLAAYFFQSSKVRQGTLIKFIVYSSVITFAYILAYLFFDKTNFSHQYSTKAFNFVQIVVGLLIAVEVWSNIENAKRMGVDILGKFGDMASKAWDVIRKVKGDKTT